jgi:lipoyl(octanoyl) transferase
MSAPAPPLRIDWLGRSAYTPVWEAMQAYTAERGPEHADQLWLTEHEAVYTLGQAGRWEHVLAPGDIPVIPVDRGGQVTYHGPGQLMAYTLYDLRRLGIGVRELVNRIEQAVIDTLRTWSIEAERQAGAPGVYVNGAKIAALGLRVRRGCSFHGLAFNVCMDLEPYARINPCGYQGLRVTDVHGEGGPADLGVVALELARQLARQFGHAVPITVPVP